MTADFLLELLSQEIPARMQARARNDLARMFAEALDRAGLSHQGITTWSTPRRLALVARDVPAETAAIREELKGPRTSAPPQALDGFLRKTGLTRDQLEERGGIFYAVIDKPGRPAAAVLAEIIATIVRDFPWPKSMRWGAASAGTASLRWVRPLQSIVAILGEEVVPVDIAGVRCGATTLGHRFHHPGPITIGGAFDYVEKLRACHVLVDQEEREALVRDGARAAASAAGLCLIEDEGLVVENAGLTEWPVPLLGRFDPDFLDVPREVIVLTMRTNQRYFACTGEDGALAPAFVCTANIAAHDGGASIVEGNRRVLAARLSDARFFWEQDLKVPLEEQAAKLSGIVFHEKLGTVADKVERVAKLARWLVEEGIVGSSELADMAERAARLCKADLVTGMVGEFPELQGIIGGYLAAAQGEPREISDAIRDHYKPVGQGDEVPTAPVTVAVSLADKLDSLVGFFGSDERPTGSRDPFGLRRAALGLIQIILQNHLRLDIESFVVRSVSTFVRARFNPDMSANEYDVASAWLKKFNAGELAVFVVPEFLADRLKVQQRDMRVRHDLIDAAAGDRNDLVRLLARVNALQAFVETPEGADLLAGYKRAANILAKEGWASSPESRHAELVSASTPQQEAASNAEGWTLKQVQGDAIGGGVPVEEAALAAALQASEANAAQAIAAEDFTAAMAALASLRAPIDAFFDKVTVNDPDPATRARRLDLLARFRDAVHSVADFSKIEG